MAPNQPTEFVLDDPKLLINRELSLLEFQRRVLEEAQDPRNPLLERVKFLAIFGSNIEEFFMVRVGGLRLQRDAGVTEISPDGRTPAEQLAEIRRVVQKLMEEGRSYFTEVIQPELRAAGIFVLHYEELNQRQRENADTYFREVIFPVLTPLAFDPGHPFPHISNLSMNLAVSIVDERGRHHFARVKVPPSLPQLVPIKRSSGGQRKDGTVPREHYFVWIEELIQANLALLFPGMQVLEAYPFHVTRNADLTIREVEADDLLETMEESVRQRRFSPVVRLVINKNMPPHIREILTQNMKVDANAIYPLNDPLVLSTLMGLTRIERHDLKDRPFIPAIPPRLRYLDDTREGADIFSVIREGDVLLHHPYDSFLPVVEFLRSAARDPDVLAIKQTLYRVGNNSPVVKALLEASREYGKQVAVLVELKARFDEESNISWARLLEQEGVHVTYGLLGLKTHSKVALVVRREDDRIRRYVHLGTGNYNHVTAHIYEDLGLFTCDEEIGADATDLFNYLTGYSAKSDYRKLLVAPINLRERFNRLVQREMELGSKGHLIFKMNALVDAPMIRLLYQASQAGVKIDLLCRGACCLRPGIKGLSENIRVISILGRFLEHSRVYYFHNNGKEEVLMGSADLMPRNLNQRVEVLFPVQDPHMIRYLRDEVLETYLRDNVKARLIQPDGSYVRVHPDGKQPELIAQERLLSRAMHTA